MQAKQEEVFKQNKSCIPSPSQGNQTIRPPVNKFISRNVRINIQTNITQNFNMFREIWKQKPTHVNQSARLTKGAARLTKRAGIWQIAQA